MAANSRPCFILCSFILLFVSSIPQSFSQSTSQQNIQTYYPTSPPPSPPILRPPPPPAPANDPPNIPPTTTIPPPQVPSPPGKSSTRAAVGRAIGVTAASTIVLSGLVFFLLLRYSKRKRERDNATAADANGRMTNPTVAQSDNFSRFNGNLKGVIVDENGLDVLYWRNLEEGQKRTSFKKQYYMNLKDEQKQEEKRLSNGRGRRNDEPVQELPLLRGKSSTSQSAVWGEKQERIVKKAPTLSSGTGLKSEEKQDSSVGVMKTSTPPLPPPPGSQPALPPPQPILASGAVPKGKMPVAPPPSSMPPPPPPPNHLLAAAGVRDGKGAAPLPPPPISSNKSPAPPPPPLPPSAGGLVSSLKPPVPKEMPSKRSSSVGEATTSNGNGQVKLKPLHWDKVNPDVKHSMVWDNIDKGSFKFDGDMMEALFGYVAINRKSPKGDGRSTNLNGDKSGPPSQIFILDTRKSQNIAIVLKSLGITRQDIINALLDGLGLNADALEKLTKIAPTDEELSKILAFDGDPTRLADAESFLYHLLKAVPSAFTRFKALLFKSNHDLEVLHIKESLQSLESACKELRTRGLFLKLLEAVLKAGNRLNAGTSRGNAQAFNLTALRKLSDVKSSDGKTTLLQFVVQEVVRAEGKRCVLNRNRSLGRTNSQSSKVDSQNSDKILSKDDREREYMMLGLPVVGGLSTEFSNVKKAAALDYDLLVKTISSLAAQVVETRKMVAECGNNGGFAREMIGFLDTAELEMQVVKEEETRVMELVKKTTDYYQTDFSKEKGTNTLQLFVIVKDFLGMVDQVCIDIARNVQKKKPAAAAAAAATSVTGSSPPESPRVFRFPKLPANFMSEYSKSSSTDSDKDSEVR